MNSPESRSWTSTHSTSDAHEVRGFTCLVIVSELLDSSLSSLSSLSSHSSWALAFISAWRGQAQLHDASTPSSASTSRLSRPRASGKQKIARRSSWKQNRLWSPRRRRTRDAYQARDTTQVGHAMGDANGQMKHSRGVPVQKQPPQNVPAPDA